MFLYKVIADNTTSNRRWLEKLEFTSKTTVGRYLYTDPERRRYFCFSDEDYEDWEVFDDYVDCLQNGKLFRAVTAMNNSDDMFQNFVFIETLYDRAENGEIVIMNKEGDMVLSLYTKLRSSSVRKATLEEIKKEYGKQEV